MSSAEDDDDEDDDRSIVADNDDETMSMHPVDDSIDTTTVVDDILMSNPPIIIEHPRDDYIVRQKPALLHCRALQHQSPQSSVSLQFKCNGKWVCVRRRLSKMCFFFFRWIQVDR